MEGATQSKKVAIFCITCTTPVYYRSKYCKRCFHLSRRNISSWNKGKYTNPNYCVDCNKKIQSKPRKRCLPCYTKVRTAWNKGKKHSAKTIKLISLAKQGNTCHLGKFHTLTTKIKVSATKRGISIEEWNGFSMPENHRIRNSTEYKQWYKAVFKRDNYTCQICGQKGGKLNADHIMPFSVFPELRFKLSNGRTLCVPCHRQTDTWGKGALNYARAI